MADVLQEILAHKKTEVQRARTERSIGHLKSLPGYFLPRRNFYGSVAVPRRGGPNLIAEMKRSSPSAGLLREDFDPVAIARTYEDAGAQALSVLTDEKYFGGQLAFIDPIKSHVGLPVLRKDFLIDPYQVHESRAFGADAVLFIADALEPAMMVELVALAQSLDLCILLEVHTRTCLSRVLQTLRVHMRNGVLLGINNRDLTTQRTDIATTEELARLAPPGVPIVSESGIKTRQDVERMHAAGARALLVGETLMRSADPRETIHELFG